MLAAGSTRGTMRPLGEVMSDVTPGPWPATSERAVGNDPDADRAGAVDAAEAMVRIGDGDDVAEAQIEQAVTLDHNRIEGLNVVVAARHGRPAEPGSHDRRRHDFRDRNGRPCRRARSTPQRSSKSGSQLKTRTSPASSSSSPSPTERMATRSPRAIFSITSGGKSIITCSMPPCLPVTTPRSALRVAADDGRAVADARVDAVADVDLVVGVARAHPRLDVVADESRTRCHRPGR